MPRIVLIRHGETAGQSSIRLWGATDVPLNEVGQRQMRDAGRALHGERFDHVIASPLSRSSEGARLVLEEAGHAASTVRAVEAFREINFGNWEGWTWEEVEARDAQHHAVWKTAGREFQFPGGESRAGFEERVASEVLDAFERPVRTGARDLLGVLHKGVIKIVISRLMALDFEQYRTLPVDLGSIHRLEGEPGDWRLVSSNETAHLSAHLAD